VVGALTGYRGVQPGYRGSQGLDTSGVSGPRYKQSVRLILSHGFRGLVDSSGLQAGLGTDPYNFGLRMSG
jgi:hypothetical protein